MPAPRLHAAIKRPSSLVWLSAGAALVALMVVFLHDGLATVAK